LTLRDAIARRYFYVWRDRWSFRTAKTRVGHRGGRPDPGHGAGFLPPRRARLAQHAEALLEPLLLRPVRQGAEPMISAGGAAGTEVVNDQNSARLR
jgi:hypothetical protein